jgi:hypothetical protein
VEVALGGLSNKSYCGVRRDGADAGTQHDNTILSDLVQRSTAAIDRGGKCGRGAI